MNLCLRGPNDCFPFCPTSFQIISIRHNSRRTPSLGHDVPRRQLRWSEDEMNYYVNGVGICVYLGTARWRSGAPRGDLAPYISALRGASKRPSWPGDVRTGALGIGHHCTLGIVRRIVMHRHRHGFVSNFHVKGCMLISSKFYLIIYYYTIICVFLLIYHLSVVLPPTLTIFSSYFHSCHHKSKSIHVNLLS